jgi:hypothetical protein
MSKKGGKANGRTSCLSLVPRPGNLVLAAKLPTNQGVLAISPQPALTKDQSRVLQEGRKQVLVIEVQKIKTAVAESAIGELAEHASVVFDEAVGSMLNRKAVIRRGEHQAYMNEFTTLMIQLTAKDLVQAHTTGVGRILQELDRTSYVEYEKPGFLASLFGID